MFEICKPIGKDGAEYDPPVAYTVFGASRYVEAAELIKKLVLTTFELVVNLCRSTAGLSFAQGGQTLPMRLSG